MEVKKFTDALEKKFASYLANKIMGHPFEEIQLKGVSVLPTGFKSFVLYINDLTRYEKTETQFGWSIEWKDSRKFNGQRVPEKITVQTEEDFLFLLNKQKYVQDYFTLLQSVLSLKPELRGFFAIHQEALLKHKNVWKDIIAVVQYLQQHNVKGQYKRAIKVPVHSKFLETHESIIFRILKFLDPSTDQIIAKNLDAYLGLAEKPFLQKMRWLDQELADQYTGSITDFAIDLEQWKKVDWKVKEIWFVENETNLYLLPMRKGALVIFSKGFGLHNLKEAKMVKGTTLYYWGDLDEHGFIMLGQFRELYPHTISVFMDEKTFDAHQREISFNPFINKSYPKFLTPEEWAGFEKLQEKNGRIEQEQLNQGYINTYITKIK